ncbi:MAG: protease modulator HflC, partial [Methylophaga sp.]|nr:protease modulator HflC [Methylophaga sp.]
MSSRLNTLIFLGFLAFIIISSSIFFVDQRERVLLLRLGQIERSDYMPGIQFKVPFVNEVRRFDGRILTLDETPTRFLTGEKKNVQVDSFILWHIIDPAKYFTSMAGNEERAKQRLSQIVKDGLRAEFGKRTIQELVSGDRITMIETILAAANITAAEFGINIVNVRIKRIDLPSEVSSSVYTRMEAERERVAKELRSQGAEEAEKIRSDADRQRTILLAEAQKTAEELRGNGDAQATDIYAQAYSQNSDFYSFYRRLTAYQNVFKGDDMLVIEPKGEFFTFANEKVIIFPDDPYIFSLNDKDYRGKLRLIVNPDGNSFDVINMVPPEPYLAGVVGAEMPGYWEPEALKAQAITARTYCFYIKKRFGAKRNWDMKQTAAHQVYQGLSAESAQIWQAVNQTKGQV